jgi:hypothetical protein
VKGLLERKKKHNCTLKRGNLNQLLVGPVVIGTGLDREITVRSHLMPELRSERLKSLDARTDPRTKLGCRVGWILVVKKRKKEKEVTRKMYIKSGVLHLTN